jgi:hypothetical protein
MNPAICNCIDLEERRSIRKAVEAERGSTGLQQHSGKTQIMEEADHYG